MPADFMVAVKRVSGGLYCNLNGFGLTDMVKFFSYFKLMATVPLFGVHTGPLLCWLDVRSHRAALVDNHDLFWTTESLALGNNLFCVEDM